MGISKLMQAAKSVLSGESNEPNKCLDIHTKIVDRLLENPVEPSAGKESIAGYFDSLSVGLKLHEYLDYTVMQRTFLKSASKPFVLDGDLGEKVKSVFEGVFDPRKWDNLETMKDAWEGIPEEVKKLHFNDSDVQYPGSIYHQAVADFAIAQNAQVKPTIPDNLYDIKSGQPLQPEDVSHGEKPAARSIVPVQA